MSEHDIITSVDEIEWNDNMIVFETDCCVPYNQIRKGEQYED